MKVRLNSVLRFARKVYASASQSRSSETRQAQNLAEQYPGVKVKSFGFGPDRCLGTYSFSRLCGPVHSRVLALLGFFVRPYSLPSQCIIANTVSVEISTEIARFFGTNFK